MQKLKYSIIDKMIEKGCTSAEVNFICHIAKYQDDTGFIQGVYYKEICSDLNCADQTFYNLMNSLEAKGIIKKIKASYWDYNIVILGNDFTEAIKRNFKGKDDKYINLNHEIFYNKDFYRLKAGEKLLAMKFLVICLSGRGSYNKSVKEFFEKYKDIFNVTKRVIQNYLTTLKKFFSIGVKDKQYWITPKKGVYKAFLSERTDDVVFNKHFGKVTCRREKVKYTEKKLEDTLYLLWQYKSYVEDTENIYELLRNAVVESLKKANKGIREVKWNRELEPKLVHTLFRKEMGLSN